MIESLPIVRVAPNISPTAGHYGHLLVFVAASWIARTLAGRFIVRIDWSVKTRGSLHSDATSEEFSQRDAGFRRLLWLARACGASELIDERCVCYSLDGIHRPPTYRTLPPVGSALPIAYFYGPETLDDKGFSEWIAGLDAPLSESEGSSCEDIPLITEQTHPRLSLMPSGYVELMRELCAVTGEPPRRFHKAYCHLWMDSLLGVTHVVRGNDFHSNRIRDVHEIELARRGWGELPKLVRVPLVTHNQQKVSSSEEDGLVGLYPVSDDDVSRFSQLIVSEEHRDRFHPTLDSMWFLDHLGTPDALLGAPFWRSRPLVLDPELIW